MPSSENRIIIACAGSGKTTRLVNEALANRDRRIALVTYTNNNARGIGDKFGVKNSGVPKHVDVMTWFGFLLRECARPYQRAKYAARRIESLLFVNRQSAKYIPETDAARHYFANGELLYSDKIAKFVVECEANSSNAVSSRLGQLYTDLFIDECQDLAGWDLDVIKMFLESGLRVTLVGDPRQHIYRTNPSSKNKKYLGIGVLDLVRVWERQGSCSSEFMNQTYRCNIAICEFANRLWPNLDAMSSLNDECTGHDGVFLVSTSDVGQYVQQFTPQVLRYDRRANTYGCDALNFGASKGLQFDRVLIVPTDPIRRYLADGDLRHVKKSRDKLHVAITRARNSVAFVYDRDSAIVPRKWRYRTTV